MNENKVKAVIFDWAGTTVDFGCMAPTAVFVEGFRERGIEITIEEAREPMGLKKIDHVRALLEMDRIKALWQEKYDRLPQEKDIEEIYESLEPNLVKIVNDYCDPVPGMVDLMAQLQAVNIKVGSTTGYTGPIMEVVESIAAEKGYKPDSVVNSSDVEQGRPAPWMCFENARKLNVFPMHHIVKVGDTVADIREGIMSGMWTVGVINSGNEIGMNYEDFQNADKDIIIEKSKKAVKKLQNAGAHYIIDGVWELMPIIEEINKRIANNEQPKLYA